MRQKQSMLAVPNSFFAQRDQRLVADMQEHYKRQFELRVEATNWCYTLYKSLDKLTSLVIYGEHLPDDVIRASVHGRIGILTGAFHELEKALKTLGINLHETNPDAYPAIAAIADAIEAINNRTDPRGTQLMTAMRDYFGVMTGLEGVTKGVGREPGIEDLTYYLGRWGDELQTEGMSYRDAAQHILDTITPIPMADRGYITGIIYHELNRRSPYEKLYKDPDTGKALSKPLSRRGDYLREIVRSYREGNSKKVVGESGRN